MTALEACDKIEEAINGLHPDTKDSGWDWSFSEEVSDEGHIENMRETLRKTREHFDLSEMNSMWFVSTNGTDLVLANCGNSPTAQSRARYISWCNPTNIKFLIDRVRELESKLG